MFDRDIINYIWYWVLGDRGALCFTRLYPLEPKIVGVEQTQKFLALEGLRIILPSETLHRPPLPCPYPYPHP